MRRHLTLAALLLAAIPLSAFARTPAWVKGQDPRYPDSAFATGVGVGDGLESARSSARAEMARTFRARVQQSVSDRQTEASSSLGKKRGPAAGTQASETRTLVSTDGLLEGVQIAETWYDKKSKKYYALAVLNKTAARRQLSLEIADKAQAVRDAAARAGAHASPVARARALARAVRLSRERDELAARRRAVDPAGMSDLPEAASTHELEKSLEAAMSRIRFQVEVSTAPDAARLRGAVVEKLSALGFAPAQGSEGVPADPGDPAIRIRCGLTVAPFDRGNPSWKFFQWRGIFEMSEAGPGGRVLASSAPSGEEGHPVEATARLKSENAGEAALAREAQEQVSRYILGND